MFLIVDVGNTRVKSAVFQGGRVLELFVFEKEKAVEKLKEIDVKFSISHTIVSSVATFSDIQKAQIEKLFRPIFLNSKIKVPFKNLYGTPKTLGPDRIALAAAAVSKYEHKNTLIIDAGTCITFDLVTDKKEYLGGAISPGIRMRYKALHHFTSKLPLLETEEFPYIIGTNTNESIHSGVVHGVLNEIKGVISVYKKKYTDLTVVLTGGDTNFLLKQLKSVIFANPNFILEGLYTILIHNLADD